MYDIKSELRYIFKIGIFSFLLTLVYFLMLIIHEHIWKSEIVFYSYIKILFFCFAVTIIILFVLRHYIKSLRTKLRIPDIVISSVVALLLSYAILFTIPVIVDRSFSVFILGTLNKYEEPVPVTELEQIISRYFYGRDMVGKRIDEQLATKSIIIDSDTVILTKRGRMIADSFKLIGKVFNLDMGNIAPE